MATLQPLIIASIIVDGKRGLMFIIENFPLLVLVLVLFLGEVYLYEGMCHYVYPTNHPRPIDKDQSPTKRIAKSSSQQPTGIGPVRCTSGTSNSFHC